jgi:hypothetical protein
MIVSPILRSVVAVAAMTALSSGEPTSRAPHPLSGWVEAHVTAFGPGIWDVSVRYGGYVAGTAPGAKGEFTGQLTQEQHAALAALVALLPRDKRTYSFGRDPGRAQPYGLNFTLPSRLLVTGWGSSRRSLQLVRTSRPYQELPSSYVASYPQRLSAQRHHGYRRHG